MEESDILMLDKVVCNYLFQPSQRNKKSDKNLLRSENKQEDQIVKNIQFLQSLDIFQGISHEMLVSVTCNMQTKRFSFGEYIIRRGEIPKGLIVITDGVCKIGYNKISQRQIKKR